MVKKGLSIVVVLIFLISMFGVIASMPRPSSEKICMFDDLKQEYKENITKYEEMVTVPDCKYTNDESACLECVKQINEKYEKNNQREGFISIGVGLIFIFGSFILMIYGIAQFVKRKKSLLFMILSIIISTIIFITTILLLIFSKA